MINTTLYRYAKLITFIFTNRTILAYKKIYSLLKNNPATYNYHSRIPTN